MFGSLNNLAHRCSVASFPPCLAAIPIPLLPDLWMQSSAVPLKDVQTSPLVGWEKGWGKNRGIASLDGPRQQQGIVSHVEKTREREGWKWIRSAPFSHLFPSFHLRCVFPLCCRQTALTNLWAGCYIFSPRRRWNSNFTKDTPSTWKDHRILVNSFMWGKCRCFLPDKPSLAGGVLLSPSEFSFWPKNYESKLDFFGLQVQMWVLHASWYFPFEIQKNAAYSYSTYVITYDDVTAYFCKQF